MQNVATTLSITTLSIMEVMLQNKHSAFILRVTFLLLMKKVFMMNVTTMLSLKTLNITTLSIMDFIETA